MSNTACRSFPIRRIIPVSMVAVVVFSSCGARIPEMKVSLERLPPGSVDHVNREDSLHDGFFADSAWPGAHRDVRNSDYEPYPSPDSVVPSWQVLEGNNFFMGPSVDAAGNVYVTTAGGPGFSHLHSYDRFGNLRWESPPMESFDDLDYKAFVSAPVLGDDDDIYLADANQLRRYRASDGEEVWVIDLPPLGINDLGFSAFPLSGDLLGYAFGDGNVAVFRRNNGELAYPVLQLPGVDGPEEIETPPGTFENLVYGDFIQDTWNAIFGMEIEMCNTPCVHPETGRIFIIATGRVPDETVLYGIDLGEGGLEIAFETLIGTTGSGTSPTLGHDGKYVYVTDGLGRLNGVDAETGEIAWASEETSVTGVSPTTTPDNRVYTSDFNWLKCWDGSNGDIIWKTDVGELGRMYVKGFPAKYGRPWADIVSGVLATEDRLWVIVAVSTVIDIPEDKQQGSKSPIANRDPSIYKQPLGFFLASYDLDGRLVSHVPYPDSGALMAQGFDGRIYSTSLSVVNSIALGIEDRFPFFMRNTPDVVGGLTVYEPESFTAYAEKVESWIAARPDDERSTAAARAMEAALPSIREQAELRGE